MAQPINPFYPMDPVRSVDELMDIAASMEVEAARRFEELAALMERAGNVETANLFRELAEDEVAHEHAIADWAAREHRRAPQAGTFEWRMPETFGLEDAPGGEFLTPYEALGIALDNEDRAFAFYTYLAAVADTDEARRRAEALATGELGHVARLRYRRLAMRRREGIPTELPPVTCVADLEDLARELERDWPPGDDDGVAAGDEEALRVRLRQAEEALSIYLAIAERTSDEGLLEAAQARAERAVARVSLLSTRLDAGA